MSDKVKNNLIYFHNLRGIDSALKARAFSKGANFTHKRWTRLKKLYITKL
jgi:hypothetical protein